MIRHIVDGDNNYDVDEIMKKLHVRKAAKNYKLYCAMTTLCHCTKAFGIVRQLARFIRSTYGSSNRLHSSVVP